jgi:hypothetical protein
MFHQLDLKTFPSFDTCVQFAYEALKDDQNPNLSLAWSALANGVLTIMEIEEMGRVVELACNYSDSPTESNLLALRNGISKWRSVDENDH